MSLSVSFLISNFVKAAFFGLVRHAVAGAGAALVTYGVLTPQDASGSVWTGSLLALAGVAWSVYQKWITTGKAPSL